VVPPRLLAAGLRASPPTRWQPVAAGLARDPAPQSGPTPPPHRDGTFVAYGASRRFPSPGFWRDRAAGTLFLFHLHGFAPLAAYAAGRPTPDGDAFWQAVVEDWLRQEATPGRCAWHPHPTSLRIIAWTAAVSGLGGWPAGLRGRVAAEVVRQGRYLRRTIEHDVGGNHVLKNATALAFAGALAPSSGLLATGLRLLRREVARQFLTDGGHEERSTSYHRQCAHDLGEVAELLRRLRRPVPAWLEEAIGTALRWQERMTGPDGRLPLLNDAWEGPPLRSRETEPLTVLADSGYVVMRNHADQAIFDVGPMCPPYLPPHAHADVLSFTLWIDGRPVIVDPGSYAYTGEWRDRFRGTAAHNTVEVAGLDQCEFWGDFRAAFLPSCRIRSIERQGDVVAVTAAHDGYRRLRDPVRHQRTFVWWPGYGAVVVDRLEARFVKPVRSFLHLAPDAALEGVSRLGELEIAPLGDAGSVRLACGAYAPALGTKVRSPVLEDRREVQPGAPFGWKMLRAGASATVGADRLMLHGRDGSAIAIALPAPDGGPGSAPAAADG
jgi:hypothetical protein